jgi:hypothetical protein
MSWSPFDAMARMKNWFALKAVERIPPSPKKMTVTLPQMTMTSPIE